MKLSEIAAIKEKCERGMDSPGEKAWSCDMCPLFKDIGIRLSSRESRNITKLLSTVGLKDMRCGSTQGIEEVRLMVNPCFLLEELTRKIKKVKNGKDQDRG